MLTWQADGRPGLEGTRVHFGPEPAGFRAHGRIVRPDPEGDFTASYSLVVREDGTLGRLSVSSATTGSEKHLTISRTEGFWLFDDGSGSARRDYDGADVGLAFSPLFNALPIRRLNAHRERIDAELPLVFVSLPHLEVTTTRQRYRTVRVAEGNSPAVVEFSWAETRVELEVDADGFVLSYPGLAALVSNERAEPATQG
ncbi:putative glycolipid-binding domain-containing protein [Pseudonocardia yuanmonensis]|uniref:Glycolipid-binding domain-containing protein n=2 Tax=Pseudonocardia yuanmonensis TaxID=1095914 RepID=A0ABP8XCC1_9PSEU